MASSPAQLSIIDEDPWHLAIPESRVDRFLGFKLREWYSIVVQTFGLCSLLDAIHYRVIYVHPDAQQLANVVQHCDAGLIHPTVSLAMSWTSHKTAVAALKSGHTFGKIVLDLTQGE